ncbi:transcriptional regulator [Marinomonas sp. MED121]|uniref:LysR family transcriptional regulator n=1 Tax=Marinomonas sp. MED121 TaxID=314277 RepID=UPI000068FB9C|nr:LysR family transcriptional regulator [Marinomonas sp. MED121]EAQ65121.1 transcriptional regulator [Marinomonas sp. MED121]
MSFTLRQLRYFVAVAETNKLADAAASVNISPSSITEAIKELEHILGADLIERNKSGVRLTCEGYRFLQSAQKILAAVAEAKNNFRQDSPETQGYLTLASSVTVSGYFLSNIFEAFRRAYPNIKVEFHEHSRVVIERKVEKEQIDIGIVLTSNIKDTGPFESTTLLKSQRHLWLSASHPLIQQDSVSLVDIANENYIQLLIDEAEKTTSNYWQDYKLKPEIIFRTESVEAVRNMVAIGAGVTILSDMVYRPWSLEGDRIEVRPVVEDIPTMDTGLIWLKNKSVSREARLFIDFCRMKYTSGLKS